MPIPPPDRETEERLRREDLGLAPALAARLDPRPDLRRALATAMRLAWSHERWAQRQGVELCRTLAATDPDARHLLLAPLDPRDIREDPLPRVQLTDGPWIPLEVLAELAALVGPGAWGEEVRELTIRETPAASLPRLPASLRSLVIEDAPHLRLDPDPGGEALDALQVVRAEGVEPWSVEALSGHRGWVRSLQWGPGGAWIASGGSDAGVRIWAGETLDGEAPSRGGALRAELTGHARPVLALAPSPRGSECASASVDGTVRIWRESAGRWHEHAVLAHGDPSEGDGPPEVGAVAWSPDGTRLATACDDGEVRVWSVTREGWRPTLLRGAKGSGHAGPIRRVAWSPEGLRLASTGADGTVRLWVDEGGEFTEGGVLAEFGDWVRALAWSPDGRRLAAGSDDGCALLLHFPLGRARRRGAPARRVEVITALTGAEGWVRWVEFADGGDRLAVTGDDGVLRLYPVTEERELAPEGAVEHGVRITAAAWAPRGQLIATGDDAGVLRVIATSAGNPVVEGHAADGTIGALAWHPRRAELWSGSDDRTIRVWRPSPSGLGPVWGRILSGETLN